jgi:beta-glucanase (GH16 family)
MIAGRELTVNHGSLHGPGYSGGSHAHGHVHADGRWQPAGRFHAYRVEWETNTVRFHVDETNYETRNNTDVPNGAEWVYDHPFFMILNVALGGSFGGAPDSTTMLPQTMTVDYVRVYEKS